MYLTQKIDLDDDLLTPFYKWFKKIAASVKSAYAICLFKGRDDLPANVKVFSLGKERGNGRLGYLWNLYRAAGPLIAGKKIDLIFIHMNEMYVYLLWPLAKLFGIPMVMWKAHGHLSRKAEFARYLVNVILTSSLSGYAINTPKRQIIGQGTDTEHFKPDGRVAERVREIIAVGRISPVKNYETIIEAANYLINEKKNDLNFTVYGAPPMAEQASYFEQLKDLVVKYNLTDKFYFPGSLPHHQILEKYLDCDILVNTSNTGSLDKVVLEAMACEKIVINSNTGYAEILSDFKDICLFEQGNSRQLIERLEKVIALSLNDRLKLGQSLRSIVVKDHNINILVERILSCFEKIVN